MARAARDYDDIPGTYVFDSRHHRKGYALNMFCMSLNDEANREAFRADPDTYLDGWSLTPEQRRAVEERDWLGLLQLGRQHLLHVQAGRLRWPVDAGRRRGDVGRQRRGVRGDDGVGRTLARREPLSPRSGRPHRAATGRTGPVAELIGGIGTSHVPAIGAAIDNGKQAEPYWAPYFDKIEPARGWMAEASPDVCLVVYNDHASAFSLELIPTFALGVADRFPPGRRRLRSPPCANRRRPPRAGVAPGRVAHPSTSST